MIRVRCQPAKKKVLLRRIGPPASGATSDRRPRVPARTAGLGRRVVAGGGQRVIDAELDPAYALPTTGETLASIAGRLRVVGGLADDVTIDHDGGVGRPRDLVPVRGMLFRVKDLTGVTFEFLKGREFAPKGEGKALSERVRGNIIHGVLERISEDVEMAQLLESMN